MQNIHINTAHLDVECQNQLGVYYFHTQISRLSKWGKCVFRDVAEFSPLKD